MNILKALKDMEHGRVMDLASDLLVQALDATRNTGRKSKVTITIETHLAENVQDDRGTMRMDLVGDAKLVQAQPAPRPTTFYVDREMALSKRNPNQVSPEELSRVAEENVRTIEDRSDYIAP